MNQTLNTNSRLTKIDDSVQILENNLSSELAKLKAYVEESRKIQETNNKQVKKILAELSSLVDSINANYVSKDELQENSNKIVPVVTKDLNTTSENNITKEEKILDESWKSKKSNEILELAIKDLNNNAFEETKVKLNYIISKQYKPARANFYLGEVEYKQQNYNNAIVYYKKSSSISTKGDYFPKLLYHTAISLDKVGDTKSANGFYKALKTNYPNSPEVNKRFFSFSCPTLPSAGWLEG